MSLLILSFYLIKSKQNMNYDKFCILNLFIAEFIVIHYVSCASNRAVYYMFEIIDFLPFFLVTLP